MELQDRLAYLESVRDWQELREELEKGIGGPGSNETKAKLHLQLGRLLDERFLLGVKALKHFQDAYKLSPALIESLEEARRIYWDLGKLNMVQKLLDLELKANPDGDVASALLVELGDVLCDLEQYDNATPTYARALGASQGRNKHASAGLEDAQVEETSWDEHVGALVGAAHAADGADKTRLFLRAARILRRFQGAEATEGFLRQAYRAEPTNPAAAALFESLLADQKRFEEIESTQREILAGVTDATLRGRLALAFGRRWAMRHQNPEVAARFLEDVLGSVPENEAAFAKLVEIYGAREQWADALRLADRTIDAAHEAPGLSFVLSLAGSLAWRHVGDLMKARAYFSRLAGLVPDNRELRAFEMQIGEKLAPSAGTPSVAPRQVSAPPQKPSVAPEPVVAEPVAPPPPPVAKIEPPPPPAPPPVVHVEPAPAPTPTPAPVSAEKHDGHTATPAPVAVAHKDEAHAHTPDEGKVAELKAQLAKFEGAKRWGDVAKTLIALVAVLADDFERVEASLRAADIYANQLRNQVEAIKAFELVRSIEPNNGVAIDFLVKAYEARREFEKLLALRRHEADEMPHGPARAAKFAELARLATEKVKKPEVCIAYWKEVVDNDGDNIEAITQLGGFYERAKDFEALAGILEKEAELLSDRAKKIATLKKLGTIYGDRLSNDEGAVEAWRRLLALDPNDKQAQEALKKKYLATHRWDDLETFYAESGKWDEFIRVLETQEAKETAAEAKASLLFKIAQLWHDRKQKSDRAAKAYERILELDATNLKAAEALVPLYQAAGNAAALARAHEVRLGHVEDEFGRLELLRELAELYETKVHDAGKAFDRFKAAFEIGPEDDLSGDDLERLAKATSRWDEVIASYQSVISSKDDAELVTRLRLRLGRVFIDEVQKVDEAIAQFKAVYDADPTNEGALGALERLYRQTQRYEDLLAIYAKKRELAADADARREILYAVARVYVEELEQPEKAVATYKEVLEDAPEDVTALAALDDLYRGLAAWADYADVLRRRLELEQDDAKIVDLKFRLGQTLEKHLSDGRGALDNYREILQLDPSHDGARTALEGMLENAEVTGEVAQILEGIYEARTDWERLLGVLEILAKGAEQTSEKVELLRKSARTAIGMIGDPARAFDAQARALEVDPTHEAARGELEQYAKISNANDKLVEVFTKLAKSVSDPLLQRDYWFRVAALQEGALGQVDAAAESYRKVLALDPADGDALAALEQLYSRTERWTDLIHVVQKRIDLADDASAREQLYARMASIYEEKLGKPDEAIASFREVLAIEPASQVALQALDGLYARQERWTDLAENLDAQLRLAETDEAQLGFMLRLAQLRETKMGEVETAIEIYRQVLEREPGNADALAALERLGKEERFELGISEILEPLYKSFGDWAKLIGVYEVQVRRSDDPARRVELLHQIAQLWEDQGNQPSQAFDSMARALVEDPASEQTSAGLHRLAEATGRFADLAAVLDARSLAVTDPTLASTLQTAAARVHEENLQDVEGAVARYRRVLELDPINLGAAESLERLFQVSERWADLSAILQRKAEILEALDDKKVALFAAASIEEDVLQRPDPAIAVYRKVLELDPEDERALEALMKHFLELQRWNELLDVYQRKADLVGDPDDKKRVLYQMGAVWERELRDVAKAIDTYQRVLELDPADLTALGRLDVLYQTAQNWPELLSILQRESELCSEPAETISYQYRIAELYETHLGDVARAIELYRDVLNAEPSHAPTLRRLEGLKDGDVEPLAAAVTLEPIYEGSGEWARLVSVLEVQVKHAEDFLSKVELLHRIARLYDDQLQDPNRAFDTYARALVEDNSNQSTLVALESLADRTNRWPEVGKLYDAELDKLAEDPARFVDLGLRVAQIFEVQLNDLDGAVARYRRVLSVENDNQSAIRSLDRLFSQAERWQDLAQVLAREAEIGQTPDEILEFKYRLGEVYERWLGDLDQAIAAYKEVLAVEPEHQRALGRLETIFAAGQKQMEIGEVLEPLYRQFDQWEKLVKVYEAQLTHLTDKAERLAMYYRIAELHEEKLVDPTAALQAHTRAFRESPLDERAHEEAERIASAVASYDALANAYADVLGENTNPEVVQFVGSKLARTFEEQLGDQQKAEETYRYVLGVVALDPNSLENLDRIYVQWGASEQLANILVQRTKATEEALDLVELFARLGQVYEESLGRVDDAIAAYRRIFDDLEPTHEQAIAALARLYAQKGAHRELLEVYEREMKNAVGDVAEADILAKIANLSSEALGDVPKAVELWKRVLDLRGEDTEALGALAGLYERQQQWPELVDVLERQADASTEDGDRASNLARRARIFTEKLGRDDLAVDEWQRVLDINYEHVGALRAIADIRRRQGDHAELVMALQNMVERAARLVDEEELVAIFRELGKTYGEILDQPIEAADAWRKLIEISPVDFEAMAALEAIYRRDEQWTDVIGVKMQRAAAFGEPAEQIREYFEVSDLWHEQVGMPDGATDANQKVIEIDAANDRAFLTLEQLHTAAERWADLAELYVHKLEQTQDGVARQELYRKIGRVLDEKLDDASQAFDILVNALNEDFDDDATVKLLEKVAQSTNRWGDLLQTANAWLKEQEIQADNAKKISLMLRLAKWYGEDIGKPEWAMPYFQQVQKLDPHNVRVIRQVASLYRKAGNIDQVGQTLTNALEIATSEKDRKEICVELGELLERHKGQQEQAIVYYKRALDVDPGFQPAIDLLETIWTPRGAWREIIEILERKVGTRAEPSELNPTRIKLAGIYVQQQGEQERPGQLYRDVLESEPQNLVAMRGLKAVYQSTEDWPRLLTLLEGELEAVQTERERVSVLLQLAALLEDHFIKFDVAAQRLEQALEIDPNNDDAYRAVERCYGKLRRWQDLVAAYDRHIAATSDDQVRVEIYLAMGKVYADEIDDVEHAVDAYRNVTDIDPNHVPALEALSKLYDKQGETASALDAMTRVADLTFDTAQKVDMLYRIGKAQDEKLGDRVTAQEKFRAALDLDPTHVPSIAALRQIALDTADWYEAAQLYEQEQTNTAAPRQKAKLLVELGKLREEMLTEHEGAIQAFEAAYAADPENEDAALPLADEYVNNSAWERAEPLLDLLTRKASKREKPEQHRLHAMYGKTLSALQRYDRALKAYQQSFHFDPTDMEVVKGLADTSFCLEDWPAALSNYQKVLTSLDESETEARTDVYYRLGSIKRKQGQARQAITNFEKALEIDPSHRPTLEALVGVYTDNKDWKQVVEYKRQILDNVMDGEERFVLLVEIGDVWADQDKNVGKAIEALEEALELKPENHQLLHKLVQHYQAANSWSKMIEMLERIAQLDPSSERKSKYFYTIAQLYRDKEENPDQAVEFFNQALDQDPTFLKAFEAINKILTQQKDWKGLERAYRKMLHRVTNKGQTDLEFSLWHGLGLIYRDRLGQPDAGVEAFKMSSRLKPEDMVERQILAELYERNNQLDKAVAELQDVLARDPMRVDPYQALYKLYMKAGQFDQAWCIAAALAFLNKADGEQRAFFEERRPKGMLQFRARLDNDVWVRAIFHQEQDKILGKIFEMITPAARTAKLLQLKGARQLPDLPRKFLQDPASTTVTFAKSFFFAAQVLNITPPQLYVRNDVPGALTVAPMDPPSSVAGSSVLSGFTPQELMFLIGKHLTAYRGEHYLKTLFPSLSELKTLLFAAMKIVSPEFPLPPDIAAGVTPVAGELVKYMQPIQADGLRLVVKHFVDAGAKADIKRWMQTSDITAARAGFVLCGDLELAAKLIRAEPVVAGELSPTDKLKELIQYAVSDQYFQVRRTLGIATQ
jgi:tetratricopeptide (TPR) repeat protein